MKRETRKMFLYWATASDCDEKERRVGRDVLSSDKALRAENKRLRAVRVAAERFMRSLGVEFEGPAQAELRSAIWWSKKPLKKGTR